MRTDWPVTPLGDTPVKEVGDMLGRAFADNPAALAALAHCDAPGRLRRVIWLNTSMLRATMIEGEVELVRDGGKTAGASLFFVPGGYRRGPRAYAWMAVGALGVGVRGAYRYSVYDNHVSPLHPKEPCYYLFVLGVEPELQGRGIGSVLLSRFCDRADRDGVAAYLETDKESSVRLYQRHGFAIVHDLTIKELGGLRVWTMLRPPKAA